MDKEIRRLPDSELEIMQLLWDRESAASWSEIGEALKDSHPMAKTTILTLLSRLAEKGFVSVSKAGRGSVYAPLVEKRDYLAAQGSRFYEKICGGSMSTLATALCDSGISREDLAELRRLLEENSL